MPVEVCYPKCLHLAELLLVLSKSGLSPPLRNGTSCLPMLCALPAIPRHKRVAGDNSLEEKKMQKTQDKVETR